MEEIYQRANLKGLVTLVDILSVNLIEVDGDCTIVGANKRAKQYMKREGFSPTTYCESGFPGVSQDCGSCPYKELKEMESPFLCRQEVRDKKVRESFLFPSEDQDRFFVAFIERSRDEMSDDLLKESERLKRAIFDNLSTSFIIVNREGEIERSHFVDSLSTLLGRRSYSTSLSQVLDRDIAESVLSKARLLSSEKKKDLIQFRLTVEGQTLWLNFHINLINNYSYFITIEDKSRENQFLERLEQLTEVEINCQKVNELAGKVMKLNEGILGYARLAKEKSDHPVAIDILDSLEKLSEEGKTVLDMIEKFTKAREKPRDEESFSLSSYAPERDSEAYQSLSLEQALERLEGNHELYNTIAHDFINDYSDGAERLDRLLDGDFKGARILVHSIKGVAGIIGGFTLQNSASLLEGYIRREQWDEIEHSKEHFLEDLDLVLADLKSLTRNSGKLGERDQWSLHGITLIDHQKDRLRDLLPQTEIGDYNGLIEMLSQFASFEWGDDWSDLIRILREKVEALDFDSVLQSINTLL